MLSGVDWVWYAAGVVAAVPTVLWMAHRRRVRGFRRWYAVRSGNVTVYEEDR